MLPNCRHFIKLLISRSLSPQVKNIHCRKLLPSIYCRTVSTTSNLKQKQRKEIVPKDALNYDQIAEWNNAFKKPSKVADGKKNNYFAAIKLYIEQHNTRKGHLEFIYAAMKQMEAFGVHKDLEAYRTVMDVFPKDKFVSSNLYQVEFFHFPYHQDCALLLMQQMEDNAVIPDQEFGKLIVKIFGNRSNVFQKYERMMYWMGKFKHESPFPLPNPLPDKMLEKAKLGVRRMNPDPLTKVFINYAENFEGSTDKTWIVSGEAPDQKKFIEALDDTDLVFIDGPKRLWLRDSYLAYFMLYSKPTPREDFSNVDKDDVSDIPLYMFGEKPHPHQVEPDRTYHELIDMNILGIGMTGTSSEDSLYSWIKFLKSSHPKLNSCRFIINYSPIKTQNELIVATSDTPEKELIENHTPINVS